MFYLSHISEAISWTLEEERMEKEGMTNYSIEAEFLMKTCAESLSAQKALRAAVKALSYVEKP